MSHESYARLSLTKPVGQIQGSHSNPFLNKGVTVTGSFPAPGELSTGKRQVNYSGNTRCN